MKIVGNISYDTTKDQLVKMAKEVGPVISFRMVTDKETGKSKGFAFCEYKDPDSAASALRNLNGREVNGRTLRIDYADNKGITGGGFSVTDDVDNLGGDRQQQGIEAIKDVLGQLPKFQLFECIAQMKQMVSNDPEHAKEILKQNPTLSIVILHALFILGLEKPKFVSQQQQIQQQVFQQQQLLQQQQLQQQQQLAMEQQQVQQILRTINPKQLQELLAITPMQLETLPLQMKQQVIMIQQQVGNLAKGLNINK